MRGRAVGGPGRATRLSLTVLLLSACARTPSEPRGVESAPLGIVLAKRFGTATPEVDATALYWVLDGPDTTLVRASILQLRAVTVGPISVSGGAEVVLGDQTFTSLRLAAVDLGQRRVVREARFALPMPVANPDSSAPTMMNGLVTGRGLISLDSTGLLLAIGAEVQSGAPHLLAFDLRSLQPQWAWRLDGLQSIAPVSGSGGALVWAAVERENGRRGALLLLDIGNRRLLDSIPFPGRSLAERYPWQLVDAMTPNGVFAVTGGAIFRCTRAPLQCEPTAVPGSGVLVPIPGRALWLQLVMSARVRMGLPAGLRILNSDGTVVGSISDRELTDNFEGSGVFGGVASDGGSALLIFGGNPSQSRPDQAAGVTLVDLTSMRRTWTGRFPDAGVTPWSASMR